ncbi:MAG: hypothetical protein AAGF95_14850 [Chloroflexota bacterium]
MRNQCSTLFWDEHGSTYVNHALLCASVVLMIGAIYGVMNGSGSGVMREGVTRTVTHLAVHFGEDMRGQGAPIRGDPQVRDAAIRDIRVKSSELRSIAQKDVETKETNRKVITTFNARRHTYTLIDVATGERMVVQPATGVRTTLESHTKVIMVDEGGYRQIVLDLLRQNAYFRNRVTNERIPVDLITLQNMGLVDIIYEPTSLEQRLSRSVLGVSSVVAPSIGVR